MRGLIEASFIAIFMMNLAPEEVPNKMEIYDTKIDPIHAI